MRSIKVGIVGLGGLAQRFHIPSLLNIKDVEIAAICDVDENKLNTVNTKYHIHESYTEYTKMAEKSDINAVFVLTRPHESHPIITNRFLESGKDVFCEKPMAMKISNAESMVKTAKKYGRLLMIGFNRRYMPLFIKVKEKANEKQVNLVTSEVTTFKPKQLSEHGLYNGWIHSVDILRWFGGEPTKVQGYAKYQDPLHEETIVSIINFDTGACGVLLCNFNAGKYMERIEIQGDGRSITINVPRTAEIAEGHSYYEPLVSTDIATMPWRRGEMGFEPEDQHFIDCIKTGRQPLTSGEDALKSHKLNNRIYQACGLATLD